MDWIGDPVKRSKKSNVVIELLARFFSICRTRSVTFESTNFDSFELLYIKILHVRTLIHKLYK